MSDLLQEISTVKREHVAACKRAVPLSMVEAIIARMPPTRGFAAALTDKIKHDQFGLIAEMKRASPSAGPIRPDFDPAAIALAYKEGGAACLSVLTDRPYFQGRDEDISAASDAGLPILRKDFIIDPYQIAETRALGGDCVLLIMAALTDKHALELHDAAIHYGLDILIEVHDREELDRALPLLSGIIGINNRNLKNLEIHLGTTRALAPLVPPGRLIVSESGLRGHDDLMDMAEYGAKCFLIGEHLLKQPDLVAATRSILGNR
ncbi:MAG: indole-3-glycerol phosphate synthase TrpC [Alphaproteobacteria bacterium]